MRRKKGHKKVKTYANWKKKVMFVFREPFTVVDVIWQSFLRDNSNIISLIILAGILTLPVNIFVRAYLISNLWIAESW